MVKSDGGVGLVQEPDTEHEGGARAERVMEGLGQRRQRRGEWEARGGIGRGSEPVRIAIAIIVANQVFATVCAGVLLDL
jgi:hypothetical protein